ncbi:MAG TPA: glycosyltransferase 87 family protein [Actinomycetes bacterium]
MPEVVAPSRDDPVVRRGSEVLGGPLGRRALTGRRWWTPLRVLLALTFLTCGLGLIQKDYCRDNGWAAPGNYVHACYSDIPPLYFGRGLADGEVPYIGQSGERQVEYPVLTGAAMWATAALVPDGLDPAGRSLRYFDINALALAVCAAIAVAATALTAGRRRWDAAMVALAPGLALAGTINWDLYAVALLALGMLAWARERPVAAGVLIGLAAAAKFYPLFVLGPLLLLCLRAGRMREFWATLVAAGCSWAAVNVPVMVADFDGWARFYRLSQERGAGFSSVWFVLEQQGHGVPAEALNTLAGGLFAACCLGIGVLALTAPRRPRLPQLALLVVAAFLVTNKVYSPQYLLWLLPLAALARPRWRDVLIWQAGEVVHFVGIWLLIAGYPPGNAERALSEDGYGVTVLAHVAGTLWLCAVVIRDVLRPENDPVRTDADGTPVADDPAGGVLDGADDTFRLRPAT